jgi:3-oxoacyl-[acyl-carrier-protein] synthase II
MPSLIVRGHGAVSAAGWSSASLMQTVLEGNALPAVNLERSTGPRDWQCRVRLVPEAPAGALPKHPRLRRASAISRFMVSAAAQAMVGVEVDPLRLGVILVVTNGTVSFTRRFFNEVIDTPALASPLLFPETVFNAPTSHLAAYLGASGPVTTLIGESNAVCDGLHTAEQWLRSGLADACLIIGAEETDYLTSEAVSYYDDQWIGSEGAGALLVSLTGTGPRLTHTAGPLMHATRHQRRSVLAHMQTLADASLPVISSQGANLALDRDELDLWTSQEHYRPFATLGDPLGAASVLQLVLACELAEQRGISTTISMPGSISAAHLCEVHPS